MTTNLVLTDIQKGILFEVNRFKDRNYYVNQEILHFNVGLDVFLLHKAFVQLLDRHEILRGNIIFESDHFVLNIQQKINLPFEFHDFSDFDDVKKTDLYNSFLVEDFTIPIDVTIAPLMRISVFKFGNKDFRIVWDIHHIILDGASITKVTKDLFAMYLALIKGEVYSASKLTCCNKVCSKNTLDVSEAKKYWKQLLSNHAISSFLPCSSKQSTFSNKKNSITAYIKTIDYQHLTSFSNDNSSLTLNTLLQASWSIALSHYSNNENVIFGSVRAYPKNITESSVGLFINTIPMCLYVNPNITVFDYLYQVREQGKRLRDFIAISLNQIHEWSELPSDIKIFQSIINYEPFSLNKTLKSCFPEIPCEFSSRLDVPYSLILEVIELGDSLQLDLHYEAGLYDDEYMQSFLNHYKTILLLIISNPDKKIIELPIVDEGTLHKVVFDWNNTIANYPLDKTVHQLFEDQVVKTPNAIALVFEGSILTYESLNEKANQLAYYLLCTGVVDEDHVAIWLKPRCEVIVSILAILKAGGAYIPIDRNNPLERIKHLLQDSKPKIIFTETSYLDQLTGLVKSLSLVKPLIINVDTLQLDKYPKSNPLRPVKPSNLMYIIYTSGSTGKPKGALIEHFAAVNMAFSCSQRLKITNQSRVLQIASFSFDVSVAEWCMALLNGATLYLMDREFFSPQKIAQALEQYKITVIILAHSILAALPEHDLPYLKVIASGGEPLNQHTLTYWAKNRLIFNVYGITETSVCSTMSECKYGDKNAVITAGRPLGNVQVYILNKYLQPLPPWVVGEIYIGGYGVGRGYLNNPSLTQEKFIDNPFGIIDYKSDKKNKIYKTGDLGCWTDNGEIEIIGRLDDQVKLRGMRIELSEIERVLEKYTGINKAVVVIRNLTTTTKQLMACILSDNDILIDMSKLQKYLADYLPSYMVPLQIIQIDELPLTAHGKIDKKKLLEIDNSVRLDLPSSASCGYCEVTEKISTIIKRMLHRENVPTGKNFLEIGLDSIMLVELAIKLSHEFKQNIDVATLFTYTSIDILANFIKNSSRLDETNKLFDSIKEIVRKRKKWPT